MGKNKHQPKSLEKRIKSFEEQGLSGKAGYTRPGSNKK